MSIIRQTAAARSLIFCDWGTSTVDGPLLDDLPLLLECLPTHATIGINSIEEAEQSHRFVLRGDVRREGGQLTEGIHSIGAVPCLHVWMAPTEAFVLKAARTCADLAKTWGVGAIIPNPELPWWGTTNPKLLKGQPLEEQARLQEATLADHERLGRLFCQELRRHGYKGDIWTCTFFWMPPSTHSMTRASSGLIAQMMSFSNARKPVSTTSLLWPSRRQIDAWDLLQPWRRPNNPQWLMWGQQAVYHQEAFAKQLGTDDLTLPVRMAAHTYLGGAAAHSEANLAWWSWYWLRQYGWARKLVASYSPRSANPVGWYMCFNGAPP